MSTQTKVKKTVKKATVNELDEEEQCKDIVKLNILLEGISSSKFPPVEEMLKGLQDIEDLIEQTKKAQIKKKTTDTYSFQFGKYSGMLAKDVVNLKQVNQKTGKMDPVGNKYIMWVINAEWLNPEDRNILTEIITM